MSKIVTLTMNPAIDVSTATPRVAPSHKLRCGPVRRDPGGGGINVARVATRLGAEVVAVYPVGGLDGQMLHRLVEEEGVKSITLPVRGATRHDFSVLDQASGQQYRFILPGPHLDEAEWQACLAAISAAGQGADFVCASGSLPPGVPDDFYARVARVVARQGGRLALDTSGPALRAALIEPVYLIKPSLAELRDVVGCQLDTLPLLVGAGRGLVDRGRAAVVALTMGAEGALMVSAQGAWRARPLDLDAANTVGAGDSFLGAMLWALGSEMSLEDSFRYAVAGGSAALLTSGTRLCRPPDLKRLRAEVVIENV